MCLLPLISREVDKLREVDAAVRRLDQAEAINVAYVGSKHGSQNQTQYRLWRTSLINRIRKLLNRATQTVWNILGRKRRRL